MHKLAMTLLVAALACCCCACAEMIYSWPPWLDMHPTRSYYYSSSRHYSRSHVARRSRSSTVKDRTTVAAEPAAAPSPAAAAASPRSSMSLAGDGGDRDHARRLLDSVDSKLVRVHSHSLSGADKQNYDRANQLAGRARRALADQDYPAASSLATKASSLAAGIRSTTP